MAVRMAFEGMLKQPSDILKDAIEASAAGIEPPVNLPETQRRFVTIMADVAGSRKYYAVLKR